MAEIKRYGVRIEMAEPDPDKRVSYVYDAVGMAPARMDFERGAFDYGDWAGVWFVAGNYPCMVGYDGAEAYRLDPADYSLRAGGGASQVADPAFPGNAMAALPCVWLACWEEGGYQYLVAADGPYDERYRAFAHTRADGTVADVAYYPLFKGSLVDGRLRSIAGLHPTTDTTAQQEFEAAAANGTGWTPIPWSRMNLLQALCAIISCTDNSQAAFGLGQAGGATTGEDLLDGGQLAAAGQFFGYADDAHSVKVFHVENPWANRIDRLVGLVNDHGVVKAKMVAPYSLDDFSDYQVVEGVIPAGKVGGYLSKSYAGACGRFGYEAFGEEGKWLCDGFWFNNSMVALATVGGRAGKGSLCGLWCINLGDDADHATWHLGASVSIVG